MNVTPFTQMEEALASSTKLNRAAQKAEFAALRKVPTLYLMQAATDHSLSGGNSSANKFSLVWYTEGRQVVAAYHDPASAYVTYKTGLGENRVLKHKTFLERMAATLEAHDPFNCVVITGEPSVLQNLLKSAHSSVAGSVIEKAIKDKLQSKINTTVPVKMEFD